MTSEWAHFWVAVFQALTAGVLLKAIPLAFRRAARAAREEIGVIAEAKAAKQAEGIRLEMHGGFHKLAAQLRDHHDEAAAHYEDDRQQFAALRKEMAG